MDDVPLCPEWWPHLMWRLHFPLKVPHGGGNPVNYPPLMNDILANLHIHTMSYLVLDAQAGASLRATTEKRLVQAVQSLSKAHDQNVAKPGT